MVDFVAQFFELVDEQTNRSDAERVRPDIAQLERRTHLASYDITFSPQERFPDDVLIYIFAIIAKEYGMVTFPFLRHDLPPQLVLSHVCSRWRMLALQTFELWNNNFIELDRGGNCVGQLPQEWLMRAGDSTVFLVIDAMVSRRNDEDTAAVIRKTIAPFKAKRLHFRLTAVHLLALSRLNDNLLSDIEELELDEIDVEDLDKIFRNPRHTFVHLRSITLHSDHREKTLETSFARASLPWSQLRCLKLYFPVMNLTPAIEALRQTPLLEYLALAISLRDGVPVTDLTMPSLRTLHLMFWGTDGVDKALSIFTCPALTDFTITTIAHWTDKIHKILKQQYNMQRLEAVAFRGCSTIPVSLILEDAPMLRRLEITYGALMYDDAITGLSNGTLGRHLRIFWSDIRGLSDKLIEMVETRKKVVDESIERGCNWREVITNLKDVRFFGRRRPRHEDRLAALEEAGISIIIG